MRIILLLLMVSMVVFAGCDDQGSIYVISNPSNTVTTSSGNSVTEYSVQQCDSPPCITFYDGDAT